MVNICVSSSVGNGLRFSYSFPVDCSVLRYGLQRGPARVGAQATVESMDSEMSVLPTRGSLCRSVLLLLALGLMSNATLAQSDSNPKWDLFIGYQWLHPGGTVPAPGGDPSNPTPFKIPDMPAGLGEDLTYNFDPHWGTEFDVGHNWGSSNNECTYSVGPRFIWRTDNGSYFLHTVVGLNRANVNGLNSSNGIGAILGGGMDLPVTHEIAWRVFQTDYVWGLHNYADFAAPEFPDLRRPSFQGVRLRTGLVFSFDVAPPVAPAATCTVQPAEVMVGEPIAATVTTSNFSSKHTLTYSWSASGGVVMGKDTTAQVDTANAAPGRYAVRVNVSDPKEKKNNEASCLANFTVKPLPPRNPPIISISANPTAVLAGGTVNLSANCSSPDGVSTSVANWTASAGTISGSGSSATLETGGAAPGAITVNATCTDIRGLISQTSTRVTVITPPPPEIVHLEQRLSLHSIYFPTNQPRPGDMKGGLLPGQQRTLIALAADFKQYLQNKPEAHLILGGRADMRGTAEYNQKLSEQRVARVKSFLVEQGVPEGNVDTKAFGRENSLTDAQVRDAIVNNPELTTEERQRALKNVGVIRLASHRRVDITLSTTGQTSVRQFPFNSTDALTLIGGREGERKKPIRPARKPGLIRPKSPKN